MDLHVIGIVLIIIGVFLLLISGFSGKGKVAVVGFLGPIPFGFGNDKNILMLSLLIATIMIILFLIFLRGLV